MSDIAQSIAALVTPQISGALTYLSKEAISIGAACISVVSAIIAANQRKQEMRISWTRELIAWAKVGMAAMSKAQVEITRANTLPPKEASALRTQIMADLSAAVDQGRLFFSNQRSFRPDILDPLVRAFDLLSATERFPNAYTTDHLDACMHRHRTEFWRLVQRKVDPDWIRKAVEAPHTDAGAGAHDFDDPEIVVLANKS